MQLRTGPANRETIHELKNQPSQIAISLYQLGTGKFLRVCERVRLNVKRSLVVFRHTTSRSS